MLRESGIFFGVGSQKDGTSVVQNSRAGQLLSLLAIGFAQGLYALDVADGTSDEASTVCSRFTLLASR